MEISKVLEHFGGVQSRICDVLGLAPATVSAWHKLPIGAAPPKGEPDKRPRGRYVPEICAWRLDHITRGKLRIDPKLYDRLYGRKPIPYADVRKCVDAKSTQPTGNRRKSAKKPKVSSKSLTRNGSETVTGL